MIHLEIRKKLYFLILFLLFLLSGLAWAKEPIAKRAVLDNGMVLLVGERPALPIVTVSLLVKAGSAAESFEKAGLATLTAALLTHGTQRRTALEISEEIEFVGGSLGASAGYDTSTVDLTVLKKDLDLGLELLADVLLRPTFPEEELKRKVREIQAAIKRKKEEPGEVAQKAFSEMVFGVHPYGRPVEGTEESLGRITRQDLLEFHRAFYLPNNSIMAVAGDVTIEEMVTKLTRYLAPWKPGRVRESPMPEMLRKERPLVKKVHRNITQANILLGHLGLSRSNPDYYAVLVMNYILGGGAFASRLWENIRENRGLAYDVSSHFLPRRFPGAFQVELQTQNESANTAIEEVLKEIRRIREEPVSDQELEEAKAYLTGSFPFKIDTNPKVAGLLASIEYYGLGLDYVASYPRLIGAVTKGEVLRVARKYLDPEGYVLVVVADQEKAALR
ncbi:MAG: insulinase family protein [candidate division NC10 bacterium]|nr:insulinase family protein [candidate division NC10 bacterium]